MPALEIITGFVTAPSTTYTALTMAAGNTLTLRNTNGAGLIKLLTNWTDSQGIGNFRIRSPRLHDNVQGINMATQISEVQPLMPLGFSQNLVTQDTLIAELTGSAVGGDIETGCMLVYYEDLPGINARLIDKHELQRRGVNVMSSINTLALGTAGGYSGSQAINTTTDNMKANTDYALVGYQATVECACVRWQGADTGNLGIGGPGNEIFKALTGNWFVQISDIFELPLIPVFNSANKGAILIDGAQDENGLDPVVTSTFVELAP